jgi:egghead protein (zeste-white 4 protein)
MIKNKFKYFGDNLVYYFSVLFPVIVYYLYINYALPSRDVKFDTITDFVLLILKMSWLAGALLVPTSYLAWIMYGSPLRKENDNGMVFLKHGWDQDKKLVITYVSRGNNVEALKRAVGSSYKLLKELNVNFKIEVVTDLRVRKQLGEFCDKMYFYKVPLLYQTDGGAKYKARALHFALEKRRKHSLQESLENMWVFHLDEESMITPQVIAGISKFIADSNNEKIIGQGEIKYNAYHYFDNILIGAVDSIRTGDDLGRFRFQFKFLGMPLSGMHGSFMLVPAGIEHKIGFDLGGNGSITEDAYFALKASELGYKFGWVEGFIREQSPFTIKDLIKQRRRWLCGLSLLASDKSIALKRRFNLMMSLFLWKISWLAVYVTIINFIIGGSYFPKILIISSAILTGGYFAAYMVGVYRNLLDVNFSIIKKINLYFLTCLLVPVSALIEGLAVMYALARPVRIFDVVKK